MDYNYYDQHNMTPDLQPNGGIAPQQDKKGAGMAIAAFVIAIINLILCSGIMSIITVPLCVVLAIISLASHRKGKAFAIISIVLSAISAVIFGFYIAIVVKIMPDIMYFAENESSIVNEYEKTGEIPERYQKYTDPKFDKYWSAMGYDSFEDFFADYVKGYTSARPDLTTPGDSYDHDYGYDDEENTTTVPKDYDHDGEDLVVL